jgi:hypothetical protein
MPEAEDDSFLAADCNIGHSRWLPSSRCCTSLYAYYSASRGKEHAAGNHSSCVAQRLNKAPHGPTANDPREDASGQASDPIELPLEVKLSTSPSAAPPTFPTTLMPMRRSRPAGLLYKNTTIRPPMLMLLL